MAHEKKPKNEDDRVLIDAMVLRLLIAVYGEGVESFLEAPRPPRTIIDFIQQADPIELRGLFMETAIALHQNRHD